jgi:ribosomal protein S18 acetylase RimI-like enzyme
LSLLFLVITNENRSMITLHPLTPQNALIFKAARLRALQDAPLAFGSTYARESQFTDADWVARTTKWDGDRGRMYMAMEAGAVLGIAGSYLDEDDPTKAHLISMWTSPTHRQQGIGRLLVNTLIDWARLRHARTLQLMVTSSNDPAISFYSRLGFALTGKTEPYPNDPALIEYEMSRSLL